MFKTYFAWAFLVTLLSKSAEAKCDLKEGKMCLRVLGSSGKILFCADGEGANENECFTVRLQKFEERTSDGTAISGHTHNNLGTGGLTLGTAQTLTLPRNCTADVRLCGTTAEGGDLRALQIPVTTNVGKQGTFAQLDVSVYIVQNNGTINFTGQSQEVRQGDFKFDINVKQYKPCGSGTGFDACKKGNTDQTGATFAFEVAVTSRGAKAMKQEGNKISSDDGGELFNFDNYRIQAVGSSTWSEEAADVKLTTSGSAQIITYTFKVGAEIQYDPVVEMDDTSLVFVPLGSVAVAPFFMALPLVILAALLS